MKWLENNILNGTRTVDRINWPLLFITAWNSLWHCCNLVIFEGIANAHDALDCRTMELAKNYEKNLSMMAEAKNKVSMVGTLHVA